MTPSDPTERVDLEALFRNPPEAAKPWVYWYWMNACVSLEGITADLEAMAEAGIGGAYLMPIQGPTDPPLMTPPVEQLTPEWWAMVRHAAQEADRLGLRLAMHACDGFAVAGGPWITPELSMQKVVWTETPVAGGQRWDALLPQPPANEGFYRDIAVLAFPALPGVGEPVPKPTVTCSLPDTDATFLAAEGNTETFRSEQPCWIEYGYPEPFTCRSLTIRGSGNNSYQANRLTVEAGDDAGAFQIVTRLQPPRHGWQDGDAAVTHSIPPTTARRFRLSWDKAGSEPGAEDLDSAKWKPVLRVQQITLSPAPRLHQYEGKTAAVWRVAARTTMDQIPDTLCVSPQEIVDLTPYRDATGRLTWDAPPGGDWIVLRIGHTSTGHRNATGGAGRGLECDKLRPDAVRLQFDHWFGEAIRQIGPELARRVLTVFHVDSWECGSQNWSPDFSLAFAARCEYDLRPYLPALAGIPVGSAEASERFLHDFRETIAARTIEAFFGTMAKCAHAHGCAFSAESVAPTMPCDGMRHFGAVDIPMGEFWLRSPTHDKPTDIRDALSGAHVYGKPIVQAEAFTELRIAWDEHPALLKPLGDRHLCLGINRLVFHVFTHNPWPERRPGMTLNGVGLFFQRNQTWWRPGRAWMAYLHRCQALLQLGQPVVDIAVFTGDEMPRRAVLPEDLVTTLPGIVGPDAVAREAQRQANHGEPVREIPAGVVQSANLSDPADWTDPLRGYTYDSLNRDALLRLAAVRDGHMTLPGGATYALLVIPEGRLLSPEVTDRLGRLAASGAALLGFPAGDSRAHAVPWTSSTFDALGIPRDFIATDADGNDAPGIAWTHRAGPGFDLYFVASQNAAPVTVTLSLRVSGRIPELWDPVTGEIRRATTWRAAGDRTFLPVRFEAGASLFVVLREPTDSPGEHAEKNWTEPRGVQPIDCPWRVRFDAAFGGPQQPASFPRLESWTARSEPGIRHYSGTAAYSCTFSWDGPPAGSAHPIWLDLGRVADIAEVTVNDIPCGIVWTAPWRVEISSALRRGENRLRIAVTNTWANRLIGDMDLPGAERLTWTNAPLRLGGTPLREAGLLGPVTLQSEHAR